MLIDRAPKAIFEPVELKDGRGGTCVSRSQAGRRLTLATSERKRKRARGLNSIQPGGLRATRAERMAKPPKR